MVLKNQAHKNILASYDDERSENATHLLKTTDRLFDIMAGESMFLDFFRQHIFPFIADEISHLEFARKKIFPLLSQIGIAYPNSPLTVKSAIGKIEAGNRMPYFEIDGKSVYDLLSNSVFKLLYFGEKKSENDFTAVHTLSFETYSFENVPANIFGKENDFYILLRPDNHISYIGKDVQVCYSFLNAITN